MNLREFRQLAFVSLPVHEDVDALPHEFFEPERRDRQPAQTVSELRDEVSDRDNHPL
jgi:hypothetical protein